MRTVQPYTHSAPEAPLNPRGQPDASASGSKGWVKLALSVIALVGMIVVIAIPGPWWVALILFALALAPHVKTGLAVEEQRHRHLVF